MTQQDKDDWTKEATDALADANAVMERLLKAHRRYTYVCQAILDELEDRYDGCEDSNTLWMTRHIINLRSVLPPTVSPKLAVTPEQNNADLAGLVFKMGVESMRMAAAANR